MMRKKVLALFDSIYAKIGPNILYRTLAAVYLFDFLDRLRTRSYPRDWYSILERELNGIMINFKFFDKVFDFSINNFAASSQSGKKVDIEKKTGKVYFELWKDFSKEEFFTQALLILKERMEKNGISLASVKEALDDGCGSGRYSFAIKRLGCVRVKGIDISLDAIELAKKMSPFSTDEVSFIQGSVLELPFEDESFDFVFSNGVLHHTEDDRKGLREIYRILKDEGQCWLYLYGGKESLFWDIVDFCRRLLSTVPQAYTQSFMRDMGYSPGRIFHRTDFFYVPLNKRYFVHEVETMLKDTGFGKLRRLRRGTAYDWDEIIYKYPDIDPYIFGEGEMRYLASKTL